MAHRFQELDLTTQTLLLNSDSEKEDLWVSVVEATLRKTKMNYIKVRRHKHDIVHICQFLLLIGHKFCYICQFLLLIGHKFCLTDPISTILGFYENHNHYSFQMPMLFLLKIGLKMT